MNIAAIERLVREGDLSRDAMTYLLNCRAECERLDYKEALHLDNDKGLCDFARDALAMRNVGGGFIVVGVKDKSWEQVGLSAQLPYDSKMLRDKIVRASGVTLDVDLVQHSFGPTTSPSFIALILVRSTKKRSKLRTPTVASKDFAHNQAFGIRRGEIYARRGDSTVRISTQEELDDLLDTLEEYSQQSELEAAAAPSPFAVDDGTYRLLPKGFDTFVGRVALRARLLDAVLQDPRIWIVNVHGPGGVGKSALVNWATYEFYRRGDFEAILQLTAKETVLTDSGIRAHGRSLYSLENLFDHLLGLFQESMEGELAQKRATVLELLSAWRTLVVLDNMETVSDGRVLSFVQSLPPSTKAKVLLTSRHKTGAWELPLPVVELTSVEVREFLQIKASESGIHFPIDEVVAEQVARVTGGLPLAIEWIIGQYKRTGRLEAALQRVKERDSPVLEFSFRNIWNILSPEGKTILAVLSIFDGQATVQELGIASEMRVEAIEHALSELSDVTLVTRTTQQSDSRVLYSALPITVEFARHQLANMGELEVRSRRRVQQFNEQLELQATEVARFRSEFEQYGITNQNEKRAAILCRRAQSDMFAGRVDEADVLFQQARDMAPGSSYVHAMIASFQLARGRLGEALKSVDEACARATRKTGALCYRVKAEILDKQRDRAGRLKALESALQYNGSDLIMRHQYGVALSRMGMEHRAVEEFGSIIREEEGKVPPSDTLIAALTTRAINLQRLGRLAEAREDLDRGKALVDQFPQLARAADRLLELAGELAN